MLSLVVLHAIIYCEHKLKWRRFAICRCHAPRLLAQCSFKYYSIAPIKIALWSIVLIRVEKLSKFDVISLIIPWLICDLTLFADQS